MSFVTANPSELRSRTADLVQVLTAKGFGSGRVVGRNLVLTARHVVAALDAPVPESGITVMRYVALIRQIDEAIPARLAWEPRRRPDGRWPDIVLLELAPPAGRGAIEPELPLAFAECPADPHPAWAVAFPWRETPEAARAGGGRVGDIKGGLGECNITGRCSAFSRSPPSLHFVTDLRLGRPGEPAADTAARWSGASGGVVVVDGRIVGVLEKIDATQVPENQITVTPIADHADAAWSARLPAPLAVGETAAPAATVRDGFAALSEYLHTLDRTDQIGLVELDLADAGSGAVEVLVTGLPDDIGREFWKTLWWLVLKPGGPLPEPIDWPGAGLPVGRWPQLLAHRAVQKLYPDGARPISLDALGAALGAAKQPPWICVQLPEALADADLALLAAWRAAWAGPRRDAMQPFGYVLLHTSDGPPAASLVRAAAGGPRQSLVALDAIKPADLRNWDARIEGLAPIPGPSPLPRLARALRDRLPPTALRLAAVQSLLDGNAPTTGAAQPQWAA